MSLIHTQYQAPLNWLESQQASMINLVGEWAEINSGTGHFAGLARMADQLTETFTSTGATMSMAGDVVRGIQRPNAPVQVLLCGHRDTVYEPSSPFQHCTLLEDDILRGPGVADMKGGLVVMLYALLAFERSPWATKLGWEVLINADEETGSGASASLLAERAPAHQLALVFEPALSPEGVLAGARKGSGRYSVIVKGRSAHAGRNFAQGRNAIVALAPLVTAIHQLNDQRDGVTLNVGRIEGGNAINVVADCAICHLDIRITTAEDESWVTEKLTHLIHDQRFPDGITVTLEGRFHRPPKPMTPATERLFHCLAETAARLALPLSWQDCGGCCDGNNLAAAGLPVIDSLGVRGGNIHTPQEYIILSSLVERAKLVSLFLMRISAGEIIL